MDEPKEFRSFGCYSEVYDDGSLNEQEHERRVHAHAQECIDCAPEGDPARFPSEPAGANRPGAR